MSSGRVEAIRINTEAAAEGGRQGVGRENDRFDLERVGRRRSPVSFSSADRALRQRLTGFVNQQPTKRICRRGTFPKIRLPKHLEN